jgi:CRISPR/Cas system CSM-associated protein Csm4 (group 5 of RAMP superfamily)
VRWNAAVDRMSGAAERHSTACLEFRGGAGVWTVAVFAGDAAREKWADPVKAAFRWLADAGFGGEKSRGWGRSGAPEFTEGPLPQLIVGQAISRPAPGEGETQPVPEPPPVPNGNSVHPHWLLSLFSPAAADTVDWSRGNYTLMARAGRVESSGELKKNLQMVAEGSVLYAREAPRGAAPDVAPEGYAHPVFRSGFAVSIPLPEAV